MNKPSDKYCLIAVCLILTTVTLAVFWQVYEFDFVYYDDPKYVSENPHLQGGFSGENINWAFTESYSSNWHPLTWLSHMLDHKLFGTNPHGHHMTSLIFHIMNSLLLFTVLRRATKTLWQSAFVAALFAIHPLHVESVVWASERKDVLSAFFWMLAMICYVWYTERPGIWRYLLTIFIFAFGLMAKPMLVTLPLVLLLLDYWPLERLRMKNLYRLILEKVPLLILSAVSCIITLAAQKQAVIAVSNLPSRVRLANSLLSYVKYIIKMFLPRHLSFFYPHPSGYIAYWQAVGAALLLIVVSILIFKKSLRCKYLPVGWLMFLGTLVPVIGLVQVGEQAMADRYTYIPLIGLFIIVAWGSTDLLSGWKYRNRVFTVVAPLIILFLSVTAYIQTSLWRNTVTLFEHAMKVTDNNYLVHHFLAQYFYKQGEFDKVIYHESQALLIEPDLPQANNYIGIALARKGKLAEALAHFERIIQMKPDYAETYSNAGNVLLDLGRYDEAMQYLATAIKLDSNIAEAHYNLGMLYAKQGNLDKATEYLTRTIQLNPGLATAYGNLGAVLAQQGKFDEAISNLEHALRLDPSDAQTRQNLAVVLAARNENANAQPESGPGK